MLNTGAFRPPRQVNLNQPRTDYIAPTPVDLHNLKEVLGLSGTEMAELSGLAGANQWRKYTGGEEPRAASLHMLFFIAARLHFGHDGLAEVWKLMEDIGAQLSFQKPQDRHEKKRKLRAMNDAIIACQRMKNLGLPALFHRKRGEKFSFRELAWDQPNDVELEKILSNRGWSLAEYKALQEEEL